jgi:hypothetical protein
MKEVDLRQADPGKVGRAELLEHRSRAVDRRRDTPGALREAAKGARIGGERLELDTLDSDGDADAVQTDGPAPQSHSRADVGAGPQRRGPVRPLEQLRLQLGPGGWPAGRPSDHAGLAALLRGS